jgi:hypothetical protein
VWGETIVHLFEIEKAEEEADTEAPLQPAQQPMVAD